MSRTVPLAPLTKPYLIHILFVRVILAFTHKKNKFFKELKFSLLIERARVDEFFATNFVIGCFNPSRTETFGPLLSLFQATLIHLFKGLENKDKRLAIS